MKKSLFFMGMSMCAALLMTSCDEEEVAKKYAIDVTVEAPVSISELKDLKVVSIDATGAEKVVENTAEQGFQGQVKLVAGTYTFKASASNEDFNFNASEVKTIDADAKVNLSLKTSAKQASGIIFKEVYSTGVPSFYFADAFYELFNNSDEVQYLDGIMLATVTNGYGSASPYYDEENGGLPQDFYPCGNHVFYFPGTGKDYPLEPGKSVVLATKAINHSARLLADGDEVSPVDLSHADWDLFVPEPASKNDTDNPDVPNMLVAFSGSGFDFMPATSGQSLILARFEECEEEIVAFAADEINIVKPNAYQNNLAVPASKVIDAIEIPYYNDEQLINKTILDKDDSGYTWVTSSDDPSEWADPAYTGKSLRRKVKFVTPERVYYQDTNNSSEDFIRGGQAPTPWVHPTVAD